MTQNFSFKKITGEETSLSNYSGKAVLIVNVASKCGYTPQYTGLEKLHETFSEKGLAVVGFPCNQFGAQEPGSEEEIQRFCTSNYGVQFDMMSKIDVKGSGAHPLYQWLTSNAEPKGDVKWNFEKFLLDKKGNIVGRFESGVAPESEKLIRAIESALA
ncbi:MAG: glutathione peroxidase [Chloroherpetonaceae bacterium]|nr:glutathione peroxidase [Chloroherpetonaceae bacterium]